MNDLQPFMSLNWPYNPIQPERYLSPPVSPSLAKCVQEYGTLRADVDKAGAQFLDFPYILIEQTLVDDYLARHTEPSAPGTYHIITSREPPPPAIVRIGIVLRILRYVSPFPWGSPQAEANRDSEQLARIAKSLWPYVSVTSNLLNCIEKSSHAE
jgi:hypothetical protein